MKLSILALAVLGVFSLGNGREDVNSIWDQVDKPKHPVAFDELIAAMTELIEAKLIECVPGWETEYQRRKEAA